MGDKGDGSDLAEIARLPADVLAELARLAGIHGGGKALSRVLVEERSYLRKTGWIESIATQKPEFAGEMVPWFNYGVIRFLKDRVRRDMHVFEYGSGFSTLWWSHHAASVVAIDHHEGWTAQVATLLEGRTNASVRHVPLDEDGDYCRAVLAEDRAFDLIVVDGRDRVNAMRHALDRLSGDGVILFDNSQRGRYREGIDAVKAAGWREIQFSGPSPMTYVESFTSILYRPANCLGI